MTNVFDGSGLGGSSLAKQASNPAGAGFTFIETTFSFVASSTTSTIAFIDNSSNTVGSDLFLDDITVTVIPEPSSALLAGFGGLLFLNWRKR